MHAARGQTPVHGSTDSSIAPWRDISCPGRAPGPRPSLPPSHPSSDDLRQIAGALSRPTMAPSRGRLWWASAPRTSHRRVFARASAAPRPQQLTRRRARFPPVWQVAHGHLHRSRPSFHPTPPKVIASPDTTRPSCAVRASARAEALAVLQPSARCHRTRGGQLVQ